MRNTLFDTFHISYILGSLILTVLILLILNKYIKSQKYKDVVLIVFGALTVFIHISEIWVFFLTKQEALVADNILFPIYFCNFAMILLLVTSLIKNKKSKVFNFLAVTTCYTAIIGSLVSLFYPEYYTYSNKLNYHVFKGFLSHSVMMLGALYLLTNNYFKIEKKNALTFTAGLSLFLVDGLLVTLIFKIAGLGNPNSMYLFNPPLADLSFLNAYVLAIVLVLVVFGFGALVEFIEKKTSKEVKQLA